MSQAPSPFLERVLARMPRPDARKTEYQFDHWPYSGKVTDEAVGVLAVPGVDPEKFLARVMDVNHYVGPIPHVTESRAIADPRYVPPEKVRFYQRVNIPILGEIHQEIALELLGEHKGYQVAAWHLCVPETEALSPKKAIRAQYSDGAWLVAPGVVGYALTSAPKRDDVGFLKWKALTTGADVAASKVIKDNIAAMARWAAR
jgi:hypothetical protein